MTQNSLLDITWSITTLELLHLRKNVFSYLNHFHLALPSIFLSSRCVFFCFDTHKKTLYKMSVRVSDVSCFRLLPWVTSQSCNDGQIQSSCSLPVASLSQDLVMHQQQPERKRHTVSQKNSLLSVSIGLHSGGEWHTRGTLEIGYKITAIHSYVSFTRL